MPRRTTIALTLMLALLAGCGPKRRTTRTPRMPKPGDTETGLASWYGHPYHGRRAANGEIYDMEKLTAAHRTLPFETWVRVRNLTNRKTVDVRITDRGPFIDGRIIDLSRAAARRIELIRPGVAKVRLEVLRPPRPPSGGVFAVQVGAFRERRRAERLRDEMESRFGKARVIERPGADASWRVLVGAEGTETEAEELAVRIRRQRPGTDSAFVVRL